MRLVREPAIGEIVLHATRVGLRQAIRRAQARPAVGARDEFAGEPKAQLGVRTKIRDPCDAARPRIGLAHAEDVGVVEPEPGGDADAMFGEQRFEA